MTVYAKIAQVSKAVGALATDKRNAQQGYDYISADKILDRAGREMAACGLSVVPSITAESMEAVERGGGKLRYDAVVEFDMIVAADDGTTVTVKWLGRGSDFAVPDKATYKAITSGHKYFLMKLFNIGVGNEDGEHEDAPEATTTKRQLPPPTPKQTNTQKVYTTKEQLLAANAMTFSELAFNTECGQTAFAQIGNVEAWVSHIVGKEKPIITALVAAFFVYCNAVTDGASKREAAQAAAARYTDLVAEGAARDLFGEQVASNRQTAGAYQD